MTCRGRSAGRVTTTTSACSSSRSSVPCAAMFEGAFSTSRQQRSYDHRLRWLVHAEHDISVALDNGVPRSTAAGWLRAAPPMVESLDVLDRNAEELVVENLELRRKNRLLVSVCRLCMAERRALGHSLAGKQVRDESTRSALLAAIERAAVAMKRKAALAVLGLSSSRYYGWLSKGQTCASDRAATCLRRMPNQLTPAEVAAVKEMVTAPEYRHVPTGRLTVLAERLGRVFASSTTWYRLIRANGWRRPRQRVHPYLLAAPRTCEVRGR